MAFDTAHAIARRIVKTRGEDPAALVSEIIASASQELLGAPIRYTEDRVTAILSPRHFVDVRTTLGGPAPERTTAALESSRQTLASDQAWLAGTRARLDGSAAELAARSAAL
jgi:argininosuccinate lyase